MAVVVEKNRQRIYLEPTEEQLRAAQVGRPDDVPDGELSTHPQYMAAPRYGMTTTADLFTNRQLTLLTTLSDLAVEVRERVVKDIEVAAVGAGRASSQSEVAAYADGVGTYLALCTSKMAGFHCSLARWRSDADKTAPAFGRQAVAMVWDYAESMPFAGAGGDWLGVVDGVAKALMGLPGTPPGSAVQLAAQDREFDGFVLSTDPPYYDNVPYADLSDFFYVWLRRTLRGTYPELFDTVMVPKSSELVANTIRHGGVDGAKKFFEDGFCAVFAHARATAQSQYPITVYYAFKQSDSDGDDRTSSGWESLLEGMVRSGWSITATWPMRTEGATRLRGLGANALASSIVLALRPRPVDAPRTDRRGLIRALHSELPKALRDLQHGSIAPVDLPQAAIGPGMAVFSRYASVVEADGSAMTVRSALARINEILDQVLNEQEGDFDPTTRFAIAWYRQYGYGTGKFGDADNIARARNTSVDTMDRDEILTSRAGKVTLLKPADLPADYDVVNDEHTSAWEALHHCIRILETEGVQAAGGFLAASVSRPDGSVEADLVKELAFLLFTIAEKNKWTKDALSFNTFATSWPDIVEASRATTSPGASQSAFDFDEDE